MSEEKSLAPDKNDTLTQKIMELIEQESHGCTMGEIDAALAQAKRGLWDCFIMPATRKDVER